MAVQLTILDLKAEVLAISADGKTLVGSALDPDGLHAMRWTEAKGLVRLGPGVAMAASGDGSTVVGKNANGACLWNVNGRVTALTSNDGDQAEAVSRDGTVVAGTTARFRAFR